MMQREWRRFLLAVGFFTRVPVPNFPDFVEDELNHTAKYFPLIGILVGLFSALMFYAASLILPHALAVIISMTASIYLTGAFHEDGLADSADGLGGGWDRERILTIMQDSRLGTYGAIALFLMLFAKFQILNAMHPLVICAALICAHALSRLAAVWVMHSASYVKFAGKSKPLATTLNRLELVVANVFGLLPFVFIVGLLVLSNHTWKVVALLIMMIALPVLCVWWWWLTKIKHWIGGYTGDTLGAMQQMTELMFYLGVLAWSLHV